MKLEKGVFKSIKHSEIKEVFIKYKDIPFFMEYFRTQVQEVLNNKNKKTLNQKEFKIIKNNVIKWSIHIESYIYDFLSGSNKDILNIVMPLGKSPTDLEKLLVNKRLGYVFNNAESERFKFIFNLLKINNLNDVIIFFSNSRLIQLLFSDYNLEKFEEINDFRGFFINNTYEFYKLSNISLPDCLFNEKSHGSKVLSQIILKMKINQKKGLLHIMEDLVEKEFVKITEGLDKYDNETRSNNGIRINKFQLLNMPGKYKKLIKKLQIDTDKHELAIYIRYGNTVNYPEIAESIVIFLKKYINQGFSRYFSSIRILPIEADKTISEPLFDKNTKYYPVYGDEFKAAHICASSLYLSHSSVINPGNTPGIISETSGLKQDFNIYSEIELEKECSLKGFESENNLYSILMENLKNIQDLEAKLDNIGYKDIYNFILILKKIKKDIKFNVKKIIR